MQKTLLGALIRGGQCVIAYLRSSTLKVHIELVLIFFMNSLPLIFRYCT